MHFLREITDQEIHPECQSPTNVKYRVRRAARALVFDSQSRIAILHVTKDHYHKLPGGGVEENEDIMAALQRELMEEAGVEAQVLGEVGVIVEIRNRHELIQFSYCYLAKVVGEAHPTAFTEIELSKGFQLKWVGLAEAIDLLELDQPVNYTGKFIRERDLTFLRSAQQLL